MYKFFLDIIERYSKYNLNVGLVVGDICNSMVIR